MSEDNSDSPSSPPAAAGALMLAESSSTSQTTERLPRQPRTIQDLLRFAMEVRRIEDITRNAELGPLSEEHRKFLSEALQGLTVDVARILMKSIRVLSNEEKIRSVGIDDECPSDINYAFNSLMEYVDDIDVSNDFNKMAGFTVFPVLLGAENDGIRGKGCDLLAVICQNNPFIQCRALEAGFLNILINMADCEQSPRVLGSTLYALSCAMREYAPACNEFIAQNGCRILLKLLKFEKENVRTKAVFITSYLCRNYPEAKEYFLKNFIIGTLAEMLMNGRNATTEHVLMLLVSFVEAKDAQALEQMQSPAANLKEALKSYMAKSGYYDPEEYYPEKEHCDQLMKIVGDVTPREDSVDR